MWHSSPIGTLAGVLALGMSLPSAFAQNGYQPVAPNPGAIYNDPSTFSYGGYNLPSLPNERGYGSFPVQPYSPYAANPQAGPYPNGYRTNPAPPVNPYGGGYSVNPSVPYPGGYGPYQNPPVNPYNPGGYQGYQSNYAPPGTPPPGSYGAYPAPLVNPYPGPSPVVALADQLVQQADGFLQAFAPTARVVPEGQQFLAEATALRDAAARLRQVAASGGNPANEFGNIAALYQQFEARMARISQGRIGPNIRNALQMGTTIQQIRSTLQ
jgi:hypothetical protein